MPVLNTTVQSLILPAAHVIQGRGISSLARRRLQKPVKWECELLPAGLYQSVTVHIPGKSRGHASSRARQWGSLYCPYTKSHVHSIIDVALVSSTLTVAHVSFFGCPNDLACNF